MRRNFLTLPGSAGPERRIGKWIYTHESLIRQWKNLSAWVAEEEKEMPTHYRYFAQRAQRPRGCAPTGARPGIGAQVDRKKSQCRLDRQVWVVPLRARPFAYISAKPVEPSGVAVASSCWRLRSWWVWPYYAWRSSIRRETGKNTTRRPHSPGRQYRTGTKLSDEGPSGAGGRLYGALAIADRAGRFGQPQ
jgi:hypothetical protein